MTSGSFSALGSQEKEPEVLHAIASAADAGARLDAFLTRQLPQFSRSQIQRLIRDGHVQVAGAHPKPSLVVWEGLAADVSVSAPEPIDLQPEALPLSILHDDPALVVIDKPAGMVVHPAAGHRSGTLVHALLHHVGGLSGIGGRERPGIVHRLDRGTSGVMVVAKTDAAHRALAQQFTTGRSRRSTSRSSGARSRQARRWTGPLAVIPGSARRCRRARIAGAAR